MLETQFAEGPGIFITALSRPKYPPAYTPAGMRTFRPSHVRLLLGVGAFPIALGGSAGSMTAGKASQVVYT
jgi:hypothetical protein